ncbi:exosortase F system-associated protein [Flavobacterium sp.]|uniref:exosortase F system-associated membrane protein n=1 Tax=Flavobacterium sp. TaxID=239 RepID=UPI00262CC5B2|nr:exosortase F system-associated protein [Flavobacterium sp.]MDD3004994.1 exosortase F system-associated protein [Flavobacterium sp.]
MIRKIIQHKTQIFLFFLIVLAFALVRNYESKLFYDPLLAFFHNEFSSNPLPELIEWKLLLHLFFRYAINTALSLLVIRVLFNNADFIKLATVLYVLFFVVLMLLFLMVWHFFDDQLMLLFYIRRFLIQPLFLLLFIPGFYFQMSELNKTKS